MDINGWETMETAPRDGTLIDVWLGAAADIEQSDRMFYCHGDDWRSPDWHFIQDKFRPYLGGRIIPVFIQPTHWRHRPAPPE